MQTELVASHGTRGLFDQLTQYILAGNGRLTDMGLIEPDTDGVQRVDTIRSPRRGSFPNSRFSLV